MREIKKVTNETISNDVSLQINFRTTKTRNLTNYTEGANKNAKTNNNLKEAQVYDVIKGGEVSAKICQMQSYI